ncbi:AgmX/PglI C-terminal domain-containing protein [Permianibacter sp. IMCC34836]|uniref:AgmX/PglI C-terminal domain-containing protein n=1 Tax=Permianibacter fluminis TaxID=2738515 RepID=UPI001555D2CD|nr:AgmX/PglI C-terminal domain-containing protein [Permianibacter fluminis]NQD38333.1 AgmX/PglI C-terminal domain-containing protein [Permianibacter fluminis]
MANTMRLSPILPWDRIPEEEHRFRRILLIMVLFLFVVSVVITMIKLPPAPRVIKPVVPDRLVKLVVEKKELPPPPPVELPKVEEPKPVEEKPAEVAKVEPPPTEKAKPVPSEIADGKPPGPSVAKEKAKKAIAVFDALADLRSEAAPAARPGKPLAQATLAAGPGDAPGPQRALITDRAKAGSGGIVTARASVEQGGGGGGIAGSGTSRVVSGIGGMGGDGTGIGSKPASADGPDANAGKAGGGRRSDENIQQGFDNAKASIFALYNRALRSNPDLKGKVIFKLEIQPNGQVTSAEVVSSELNDPELERKLLAKVRQIDFGALNVGVWKDTYRMDFFPT